MKKYLFPLLFLLTAATLNAQVSVNQDNSAPDPSAMLDVKSTDKGMLIPRMNAAQRSGINNPANGLMVFDNSTNSFWYFGGAGWIELTAGADNQTLNLSGNNLSISNGNTITLPLGQANTLTDADNDTKIEVEQNPDEDIIRFQAAGTEVAQIRSDTLNGTLLTGTSIGYFTTPPEPGWQSFTAPATAQIQSIQVVYNSSSLGPSTKEFRIYEGEGTGGNLLASLGNHTLSNYGWNLITLPTPVNISSGAKYTIWFSNLAGIGINFNSDPYAGGRSDYNATSDWSFEVNYNLYKGLFVTSSLVIKDAYAFPTTDGTNGQVLATDGSGQLSWSTQTLSLSGSTLSIANGNSVDLGGINADNQTLALAPGAILSISNGNSVNLNGINTDNQTLGLSGATLSIANGNSVDLAGINTDNQTLGLSGATLSIANGNNVDLAGINTDNQTLGLSGATLSIANGNNVNLAGINTDNQTLSLNGSNLSISNGNTIALPLSQTNTLKDADNDTRILVEASPDEDVIHAYVKNVEGLQLNQNGLFAPGTYNENGVAPVTGAGIRLMWVPARAALRVGEVTGTQWNSSNIGLHTSVLGGKNNFIPFGGSYGTIAGGTSNTVSGAGGFVGAGESNQASGEFAGIIGGLFNVASGYTSFIGTGQYNTASGQSSVVVGGEDNIAAGNMSTVGGNSNKAASYGETTLGLFATNYTPASTTAFNASDRIFAIGNGSDANARSNALTILKSGNVGIGTTTPSAKLQVNGGNIALNSGNFTLSSGNIALGGGWLSNDGDNEGVYAATNGRVGIGTNDPKAMLHVAGNYSAATGSGNYFVYSFGNNAPTQDIFVTNSVVGFFDGDVMASKSLISMSSIQWSDARAKRILRRSDSREDLDLLKRIQITDYQWIDQLEDHGRVNKKIIAQEVEQVLPDAVSRMRKAIPNVYAKAVKVDYDPAARALTVYLDKAHDFSTGDKVRMFTDQGDLDAAEVLSVPSPDIFTVSCEKAPTSAFVYGKWVDDYRMVDYDAIAMLNVSATQELAKEVEALRKYIAELEAENTTLKSEFEQRLTRLEAALQPAGHAAGDNARLNKK